MKTPSQHRAHTQGFEPAIRSGAAPHAATRTASKAAKHAAEHAPATPDAESGDENQAPSTPATGVKTKTPRKRGTSKVANKLATPASGAGPIDVTYENDYVLAAPLPKAKGGGFGRTMKLSAAQPLELVASDMLDNGCQAIIIIKPAAPFQFMKLPKDIRGRILRNNLTPEHGDRVMVNKINIVEKSGAIKAQEYAKEFKHRLAITILNKESAAEARQILHGFRLNPQGFVSHHYWQLGQGKHHGLYDDAHRLHPPPLAVILAAVRANSKRDKATKAFFAEAGRFAQDLVTVHGGDKDVFEIITFGKHCFTIKDEDELEEWDDEQIEIFRNDVLANSPPTELLFLLPTGTPPSITLPRTLIPPVLRRRPPSWPGTNTTADLQLLMFILQDKNSIRYGKIKRYCKCKLGISPRCVQYAHVQRAQAQYISNVLMKFNAKLGGFTNTVFGPVTSKNALLDNSVVTIGADVSHAAPGLNGPSMAAMTVSMNANATRYAAAIEASDHRVETITDETIENIEKHIISLIKNGWSRQVGQGKAPATVVYFRDGVSEGQFAQAIDQEVAAMKRAFAKINVMPRFLVIIASKRYHVRFFPQSGGASYGLDKGMWNVRGQ
ncbi:Piwi-domain-containing protein [Aureobasidium pullulans]|uniref:Piwi-domain-containing protein n=1 Tax=Aureobasidium pullulans TaxID=5580 RepID=A0A4S8SIJ4_AURPU|nr:Piwi-domain-containing protein [Aureobasidium pullulans]